jgi:hypothetical protein
MFLLQPSTILVQTSAATKCCAAVSKQAHSRGSANTSAILLCSSGKKFAMWGHTVSIRNVLLVTFDPVFAMYYLTGPPTQRIPATLASVVSCSTEDMYDGLKTLWSRTRDGFSVHSCIQIGSTSRNTQFHLQKNRQSAILPSNSFPVDCRETPTSLIITSRSSVLTIAPPPMPNTPFVLTNLSAWQQSLLNQMTTEHSHQGRNSRDVTNILKTTNHCYRWISQITQSKRNLRLGAGRSRWYSVT